MLNEYELNTCREGFYDVTQRLREAILKSGVSEGVCIAYCPHTTAGMTINEIVDPDVRADLLLALSRTFPDRPEFRHREGNSAAHLKALATGSSVTVPIERGRLVLGGWQGVYFCEFDGPRTRKFFVKIAAG